MIVMLNNYIGADCPRQTRDSLVPVFKGQLTKTNKLASNHFVEYLNTHGGVKNHCSYLKREKFAAFAYNCKIADKSAILKYAT